MLKISHIEVSSIFDHTVVLLTSSTVYFFANIKKSIEFNLQTCYKYYLYKPLNYVFVKTTMILISQISPTSLAVYFQEIFYQNGNIY